MLFFYGIDIFPVTFIFLCTWNVTKHIDQFINKYIKIVLAPAVVLWAGLVLRRPEFESQTRERDSLFRMCAWVHLKYYRVDYVVESS